MLKRRIPRVNAVAVLIALIISACGTPIGSEAGPPGGSAVDLTESERIKTDSLTPEQEATLDPVTDLVDSNDPQPGPVKPARPGDWTTSVQWATITFEQGVVLMDVVVVGVIEEASPVLTWNSIDAQPWTPGPSAVSAATPESWQILTVRVSEILKSDSELVRGQLVTVVYFNTVPGYELVPATFQGAQILVGAYGRDIRYPDGRVVPTLTVDPQVTYLETPSRDGALARLYSAASGLGWSDIMQRGSDGERVGEADWVDSMEILTSRALNPGPFETQLGYADLAEPPEESATDPAVEEIVP